MNHRLLAWLCVTLCFSSASGQSTLSPDARVALWTVGPGNELYAAFGHSALRITDPLLGFDRIYNFGTFDFKTPNFYLKFIQGDLDYFLTAAIAPELLEEYRSHRQLVVEQELNLTPMEKERLFQNMETNLQPENAAYRYDFVRDNCTTRIRDVVAKVVKVEWKTLEKNHPTLREMVQPYVADRPSIKTGINLLFGANMDHAASTQEAMFLPEDMKVAFDRAIISDEAGQRPLVKSTTIILEGPSIPIPQTNWLVFATYLTALVALVSLASGKNWPRWVDVSLFSVIGLIGCFICFVWFGTRHWVLHNNWSLAWAWPTHLIIWFFPRGIQRKYWMTYIGFVLLATLYASILQLHSRPPLNVKWEQFTFMGLILLLLIRSLALILTSTVPRPSHSL